MIIKNRDAKYVLEVFENFQVDRNLPKYKKIVKGNPNDPEDSEDGFNQKSSFMTTPSRFSSNDSWGENTYAPNWRYKVAVWVAKVLGAGGVWEPNPERKKPIVYGNKSPLEMFAFVRNSMAEAGKYTERMKSFEKTLNDAKETGQIALVETLTKSLEVVKSESILFAVGFAKFLTEQQTIDFAVKCQKGLRLDYITNFTRPIPPDVRAKKIEADTLKIFDNYVILHYDPKTTAFKLTEEQERIKKDPILFGVIQGVRKLYFIGDWKDEVCDLTLEEVAKVLGTIDELTTDITKE